MAAGGENLTRPKSKLRRNAAAMAALFSFGLDGAGVDRLHLGHKEPYRGRRDGLDVTDALCFPLLGEGMRPLGRYAFLNLPGVAVSIACPEAAEVSVPCLATATALRRAERLVDVADGQLVRGFRDGMALFGLAFRRPIR